MSDSDLRITSVGIEAVHVGSPFVPRDLRVTSVGIELVVVKPFPPHRPTITDVLPGGENVTIQTTEFASDEPGEEHIATRIQIALDDDPDFTSPVIEAFVDSPAQLTNWSSDDVLDEDEDYRARAVHVGEIGGESEWSDVVEFFTGAQGPRPETPTVSFTEVLEDQITAAVTAFAHAEGVTTVEDFDPENPIPFPLYGEWELRLTSGETVIFTSGPDTDVPTALERLFGELEHSTGYGVRFRWFDGYHLTFSRWSAWASTTTLALPPVRPAAPSISFECARSGAVLTPSDYDPGPAGPHARRQLRVRFGNSGPFQSVRDVALSGPVPFPDLDPGMVHRIDLRDFDDEGRASLWSNLEVCTPTLPPPQPVITAPVQGISVQEDFLIEWEPEDYGFELEVSIDNGQSWTAVASSASPASEHMFSIAGWPDAWFVFRLRLVDPGEASVGRWSFLTLRVDRSGVGSIVYDFTAMTELPDDAVPIFDHTNIVTSVILGRGINMRHTQDYVARKAGWAFQRIGEPDQVELTLVMAVRARLSLGYGWRFADTWALAAGPGFRLVGEAAVVGRQGITTYLRPANNPWSIGGSAELNYPNSLRRDFARINFNRRWNDERPNEYAESRSQGTVQNLVDRIGQVVSSVQINGAGHLRPRTEIHTGIYTVRTRFERQPDGRFRTRTRIYGEGADPTHEIIRSDIAGVGCGLCGFAAEFLQQFSGGGEPSYDFRSLSATDMRYEECVECVCPDTAVDWDGWTSGDPEELAEEGAGP